MNYKSSTRGKIVEATEENIIELRSILEIQHDEVGLKELWCLEKISKIQTQYIEMYELLLNQSFYEAWVKLERIEIALLELKRVYPTDSVFGTRLIDDLVPKIQSLFPYKIFLSTEFLIKREKCSICGVVNTVEHTCDHEIGEVYFGKMCYRIVDEAELLGVAMVENPVNKYAVPFLAHDATSERIDHYDYSLLKYIIKAWKGPFYSFECEWKKIRHPHSLWIKTLPSDTCPCESGKSYQECCLVKSGVLRPHCDFKFSHPLPENLSRIVYHY